MAMTDLLDNEMQGPGVGITVRDYGNGKREMVVYNATQMPTHKGRKATTREEQSEECISAAVSRSRASIREFCLITGADKMVTLTTKVPIEEPDQIWAYFKNWKQRMNRDNWQFDYCAVIEVQDKRLEERGEYALHIHFATPNFLPVQLMTKHWDAVTGQENIGNSVDVSTKNKFKKKYSSEELSLYLMKYISKELVADFGRQRYRVSKGKKAQRTTYYTAFGLHSIYYNRIFEELTGSPAVTTKEFDYGVIYVSSWQSFRDDGYVH